MHPVLRRTSRPRSFQLTFEHAAHFLGNRAYNTESRDSAATRRSLGGGGGGGACGGALYVGRMGRVTFSEFVSFEDNSVSNGGWGGAVCNRGSLAFMRRSLFSGNAAHERVDGWVGGGRGQGGAVYTAPGGDTQFLRKSIMQHNSAGSSGGALHNEGNTTFKTSVFFGGNRAMVSRDLLCRVLSA